ncbi:type I methionyl aminopeptidase [Patescibacteria group bacterium]|nr:MAG: type I methionyl aminopeptidase [Patescibacteria group bacterium]
MPNISLKTADDIERLRQGGAVLDQVLKAVAAAAQPGATPRQLSQLAADETKRHGVEAAFKGHQGFPDPICISVNDAVVHGIPNDIPLMDGDIVGLDYGVRYKGRITDGAITVAVGRPEAAAKRLLEGTQRALAAGIAAAQPGAQVGDISAAIEQVLRQHKLGIITELVGHGVGYELWEEPQVPNQGKAGRGPELQPGMVIAIEPMATLGSADIVLDGDGWTIRTADGSLSAQFEHTVVITEQGAQILTQS